MKKIGFKNNCSKIVIIVILGLICFSGLSLNNTSDNTSKNENQINKTLPRSSIFLENRTDYSKQLVIDPQFDIDGSSSPWSEEEDGDISDIDENLDNNQANYRVMGEQKIFSDVNGIPQSSNWTKRQNPEFPAYPDSDGFDSDGCWAGHTWAEGPKQTPSVQWHQNFTMPVNMSDYKITSANVSAIINGSVDRNVDVNMDLGDTPEGSNPSDPRGVVYDYVRYYVSVADTSLENIYEVASYQTYELGLWIDAGNNVLEIEKYMNMILEDNLIFYLTQVLSYDHENFTVILGMNIFCEDSCTSDQDYWDKLCIKNVNVTFTYEKNIDQLTSASWSQTGNKINNNEYELGDDGYFIINNASLNFDYNISQEWPDSSLNSEFRVYFNDYLISKTIKITNFSTDVQHESFVISPSLISETQNITLKLQLFIADTFNLSKILTLSIDNVNLTTFFTVVERNNPVKTNLETTTGYLSRSIPWNENFVVYLNYSEFDTKFGINESNFNVEWSDSYEIQEIGNGIYNISCDNTLNITSLPYSLKIHVNITNTWYESKTLELKIYVVERETNLKILMGHEDVSSSDKIEVPITSQVNFTIFYYDSLLSELLQNPQMSLDGLESSIYSSTFNDTAYNFLINTSKLDLGVYIVSLFADKNNYVPISRNIQLNVRQIHTNITTSNANQSFTIETKQDFDLVLFIDNADFEGEISGCEVSYSWKYGSGFLNETESKSYSVTLENVPEGIYTIYISIFKGPNYSFEPFEIKLNVITPPIIEGIPTFVIYIMGVMIIGLVAAFIAYQQYFRFPKSIREIRSLNKAIQKGKAVEKALSVKTADDLFVKDYIYRTKGSLPSKSLGIKKSHSVPGSKQKSITKGDVKKEIGEKAKLEEKQKSTPKIPKEEKKPVTSRKPSSLEDSLEIPKGEQSKKVEPTQKIEKIKPDQFVKSHDIEKSDFKSSPTDKKPKKIRYLRKPKIKELPKKKTSSNPNKPEKD